MNLGKRKYKILNLGKGVLQFKEVGEKSMSGRMSALYLEGLTTNCKNYACFSFSVRRERNTEEKRQKKKGAHWATASHVEVGREE